MALTPYKLNQGVYARGVAGMAMLVLALLASVRLFELIGGEGAPAVAGVPAAYLWAALLFMVIAVVVCVFTFGVQTGVRGLDAKSRSFVDLLVDTQSELQKVSWPSREELRSSTVVVLVFILILGAFIYMVDLVISFTMSSLRVLPK